MREVGGRVGRPVGGRVGAAEVGVLVVLHTTRRVTMPVAVPNRSDTRIVRLKPFIAVK